MEKIKFWLDGCDIQFLAEALEDITLKQLLKQCNRIKPKWCSCCINSKNIEYYKKVEIIKDYDNVKKVDEDVECDILEIKENNHDNSNIT